jgi:hypothetical protein
MPSQLLALLSGAPYTPLISGNPWSGRPNPIGGIQVRASPINSGSIYISLSGAFVFSGVVGLMPASGGPTINSGTFALSGSAISGYGGNMDGMVLAPGDSYYIPHIAILNQGVNSGVYQLCVSCDSTCSGQARVFWEGF